MSFLFLNAHFEFVAEIFRGSINISCQLTQILVDFFENFKISLSIVAPKALYHLIFSPDRPPGRPQGRRSIEGAEQIQSLYSFRG